MQESPRAGAAVAVEAADEDEHVHVFNLCKCGAVNPTMFARHGGRGDGIREAKKLQQIDVAAFTAGDLGTLAKVAELREKEEEALGEVEGQVGAIRGAVDQLRHKLEAQPSLLNKLEKLEDTFNELVTHSLEQEKEKIDAKDRKIRQIRDRMEEIERNQMKTMCGFAAWKILSTLSCLLLLGVVVTNVLSFIPGVSL